MNPATKEEIAPPTAQQAAQIAEEWIDAKNKQSELSKAVLEKEALLKAYFANTSDTAVGRIKIIRSERSSYVITTKNKGIDINAARDAVIASEGPCSRYVVRELNEKQLAQAALESADLRRELAGFGLKAEEKITVVEYFKNNA